MTRPSNRSCRTAPATRYPTNAEVVYDGPVSVISGRQDRIVGYANQFRAMRRYPRGTYTMIDAAGHYLARTNNPPCCGAHRTRCAVRIATHRTDDAWAGECHRH